MDAERVRVRRVGSGPERPPSRDRGPGMHGCAWLLLKWLAAAGAVYITAALLPGVAIAGFGRALLVAIVLGLLNVLLKPAMVLLTLPITILTLGLFLIVINAVLLALAALLVPGFDIRHFGWAVLGALVIGLVNLIFDAFVSGLSKGSSRS